MKWSIINTGEVNIEPYQKVEKASLEALKSEITSRKEVPLYSGNDLVADIGGYLGLLLGGSIPSIIVFVQNNVLKMFLH